MSGIPDRLGSGCIGAIFGWTLYGLIWFFMFFIKTTYNNFILPVLMGVPIQERVGVGVFLTRVLLGFIFGLLAYDD